MTAAPGSRIPLVLAYSLLSSLLAAHPEQHGDGDLRLLPDSIRPGADHPGRQRTGRKNTLCAEANTSPQVNMDQVHDCNTQRMRTTFGHSDSKHESSS